LTFKGDRNFLEKKGTIHSVKGHDRNYALILRSLAAFVAASSKISNGAVPIRLEITPQTLQ